MEQRKDERAYLEGANPYSPEFIKEYAEKGWWLNLTFGDVLDRSAERTPDKTAVIDEKGSLTYGELRRKVDQFARVLLRIGIRKYDRILIQLPNCHEFLVAFYGMQRIGAVPVLAIPRHGLREISHFIKELEPKGWILPFQDGKRPFKELIEEVKPWAKGVEQVIMVCDEGETPPGVLSMESLMNEDPVEDSPIEDLAPFRPDPNDVAIILLTGGTTGMPKGVPRTHNSYLCNIRYTNAETRPDDVRALATPIGHSMAHQGPVGGSVFCGATLCLISVPRSGPILNAIETHRVTSIGLVPTQLEDILNDPDLESYDLSSLKRVGTVGSALRPETAQRARALFEKLGADFTGGAFGSSEGPFTIHRPEESPEVFRHSIGRPPCEGDHWKAVDEEDRDLPPNTEGELVARGPCIFTGYFRSEEENRKIFTSDSYYKMGDVGKIDEEGNIYITGRKKDIIQRGGEGIIPGEIEEILHLHPDIKSAAVVGMPDPRLGEKACAYVALKARARIDFEGMIEFMKSRGASVLQLPERLEILDHLPRTPVGKPDKEALRQDIQEKIAAVEKEAPQ